MFLLKVSLMFNFIDRLHFYSREWMGRGPSAFCPELTMLLRRYVDTCGLTYRTTRQTRILNAFSTNCFFLRQGKHILYYL